jgi:hypothetical protein
VAELAAVKEADRSVKAAAKGNGRNGAGQAVHPVRAAKAAARKSSAKAARRR